MNIEVFAGLAMVIVVIQKLIEALVQPLFLKLKIDLWWLMYVSLVVGALFGWATALNAFPIFTPVWVGRLLTALICGAGPTFIYDIIDKGSPARLPRTP